MRVASLPIDVAGHIAAAYRRRPPPHPVMTELPDCHRPAHATSGYRPRWQQLPFLVPGPGASAHVGCLRGASSSAPATDFTGKQRLEVLPNCPASLRSDNG
jgi:hypothetical protein